MQMHTGALARGLRVAHVFALQERDGFGDVVF
jgi:hypothetical protein